MKNKKVFLFVVILIIVIFIVSYIIVIIKKNNGKIPDDYIAVFHGGSGETTYETYIYKIDNGHANFGFDYINVTNTTKFWGSDEWDTKITQRVSVQWTDDVFGIAKENNAYSYVTLPNSDKTYTIEEFMKMFLMN